MNYADYGIQDLIDTAHDKIRETRNQKLGHNEKKIELLKESLAKIRTISLIYGERASEVFMTYLDALCDFKDTEYIINTHRKLAMQAKFWDNCVVKYLVSAQISEIVYFNVALEIIAHKAYNHYLENKKQPIYISQENEHFIQRIGIIFREDLKNYQGIKVSNNRYTIEEAEEFMKDLEKSTINAFDEHYNEILKLGKEKRVWQDARNKLINENQRTLFDF